MEGVRTIRDEIQRRVENLIATLTVPGSAS